MSAIEIPYLAEVRARAENATPGPWEADHTDPAVWGASQIVVGNYTAADDYDSPMWEDGTESDREFIAHARQDVPRLVAALEAVLSVADEFTVPGRLVITGAIERELGGVS